jgi:drug/metabolite transporter (DMT)-like permease
MKSYILLSVLAAFFWSLSNVANKFASKHKISNHWVLLFYYYLTFVPFLLCIPFIFKVTIPPANTWIYLFLYGLAFFIGNIFSLMAIYKLDVSTMAPFMQLQSAFIAILAFFFLGERFSLPHYVFILIMIIGTVLVSLDERMHIKSYFTIGIFLIVLQQIFHASSNLFAGFALKSINSFTFIFWGDMIAASFIIFLIPVTGLKKLKVTVSQLKPLLLASFFSTIAALSLFTAFLTNLTISSAISLLTAPFVLLLTITASIFKPNLLEHHTKKVYAIRALGVGLILIGAISLSLVK